MQKKYYNKKHIAREFKIEDQVMLNAKNIKQLRPSIKLINKYLGLFKVIKVIGAYK